MNQDWGRSVPGDSGLVVQENRVRGMEEIARSEGANTAKQMHK